MGLGVFRVPAHEASVHAREQRKEQHDARDATRVAATNLKRRRAAHASEAVELHLVVLALAIESAAASRRDDAQAMLRAERQAALPEPADGYGGLGGCRVVEGVVGEAQRRHKVEAIEEPLGHVAREAAWISPSPSYR